MGWDRLVPNVSLGQLEEKATGMWDMGWDSLVPKMSLGQLGGQGTAVGQVGTQYVPWPAGGWGNWEMGQGMGQFGTQHTLRWWDSSQGVTVSPTYADHIRAELTRLSPPHAYGVLIHSHPSQILRQWESGQMV